MGGVTMAFAIALLAPKITQAQGTTYLSNLGQPSTGSRAVGLESWVAAGFQAGTNASGYVLDSVQLVITEAFGNPSNFTAMVYANSPVGILPGSSLGTLNGSLNPAVGGVYTYTPSSNLTLSPRTPFFIVLTAGTRPADGAYEWSHAGTNFYNPNDGWSGLSGVWTSGNGSFWARQTGDYLQYAINATPIPEPGVFSLLILVGSGVLWYRRRL